MTSSPWLLLSLLLLFQPPAATSDVHHLAKAALAQDHDEVEVGELDPVLIAVAVVLAHRGGGRGVGGLPRPHPRPLGTDDNVGGKKIKSLILKTRQDVAN